MSHTLLMFAAVLAFASPVQGGTVFSFESVPVHTPVTGMAIQTVDGITATFIGDYSVQHCPDVCPTNLPGNFLYPGNVSNPILTVRFDQPLTGISFDFATADFGTEITSTLRLTAYNDLPTASVGSTTVLASGQGMGWGFGSLAYTSGTATFNMVQIVIVPPPGGSNFLANNFSVTPLAASSTVPEPAGLSMIGLIVIAIAGRKFRG